MTQVGWIGGADINISGGGGGDPVVIDYIKCEICCAYDMNKSYTWAFVNGIRKVSVITMKSAFVNTKHGLGANARVERHFTYQAVYPFDLVSIVDTLLLV